MEVGFGLHCGQIDAIHFEVFEQDGIRPLGDQRALFVDRNQVVEVADDNGLVFGVEFASQQLAEDAAGADF